MSINYKMLLLSKILQIEAPVENSESENTKNYQIRKIQRYKIQERTLLRKINRLEWMLKMK
jgi:hypothetical protein